MVGQQIGRYRVDEEIGRGGMGVVYRGTQIKLNRTVAIKMLASNLADADASARFEREALTLAKLAHPNIILIYDVEEFQGSQFIIMEYVDGGSLGDVMQKTPVLSPERVVQVMAPVLSGLAAAHHKGIIHRDIKPDNILFTESGRPKVTDFGIAHMRGSNSKTRTGVMLGTPYYMSPEQARGQKVTPAADIYASGILMYEALTGRVPFTADDAVSVALMHVQAEAEPIESLRPEVPTSLCAVVRRAMSKNPADRFASAEAMEHALLEGGWAPRTSGSGRAITVASTARGETQPPRPSGTVAETVAASGSAPVAATAAAGAAQPVAGEVARPTPSPGSEAIKRVGQTTGGLVASTSTLLKRPGWKGMPMAFWLGAAAITAAVAVGGVQAMAGGGGVSPAGPPSGSESTRSPSGAAVGSEATRRGGSRGALPTETQADPLTAAESESIANRGVGNSDVSSGRGQTGGTEAETRQQDEQEPESTGPIRRALPPEVDPEKPPVVPPDEPETDLVEEVVESDVEWQGAAAEAIRAIIARQGTALETENRSLFLRDVHPQLKAEAAELYDGAVTTSTGFEIETSNIEVSFLSRTTAEVTYDVLFFLIDRATGQGGSAEDTEHWRLRLEGGRWWLVQWDIS